MFASTKEENSTERSSTFWTESDIRKQKQKGNTLILSLIGLAMIMIIMFALYSSNIQRIQNINQQDSSFQNPIPINGKLKYTNQTLPLQSLKSAIEEQISTILNDGSKRQEKNQTNLQNMNKNCTQYSILKHTPIWGGEFHYARLPQQYWQHRLQMIKALGLNTVSVSILWNHHEQSRGVFDFETNQKNLTGFLKLTKKYGLKVFLKPGPYVGDGWDFGGLPARLLGINNLVIRSSNEAYEAQVFLYFSQLAKIIYPFLQFNDGNIILIQIQNQFGSLGNDRLHTINLLKMWKDLAVYSNFNYVDSPQQMSKHYWHRASIGIKSGYQAQIFELLQRSQLFKGQLVYAEQRHLGTLNYWGQSWKQVNNSKIQDDIEILIDKNISFILNSIHEGSNYGLTAGAKYINNISFVPAITSYGKEALINEQGSATNIYHSIKKKIEKISQKTTLIAQAIPTIQVSDIDLKLQAFLMSNLPPPQQLISLGYFEDDTIKMYHQGIAVYQTHLLKESNYSVKIILRDFGIVYVDDEYAINITRKSGFSENFTIECKRQNCSLKILVQAMSHVNQGSMQNNDRKGLINLEIQNYTEVLKYKFHRILLNDTSILSWFKISPIVSGPKLLMGNFQIADIGDVKFNMQKFVKGYLWINNKLIGRYWNLGPQMQLFCPGVWLKKGKNQVRVLELSEKFQNKL